MQVVQPVITSPIHTEMVLHELAHSRRTRGRLDGGLQFRLLRWVEGAGVPPMCSNVMPAGPSCSKSALQSDIHLPTPKYQQHVIHVQGLAFAPVSSPEYGKVYIFNLRSFSSFRMMVLFPFIHSLGNSRKPRLGTCRLEHGASFLQ